MAATPPQVGSVHRTVVFIGDVGLEGIFGNSAETTSGLFGTGAEMGIGRRISGCATNLGRDRYPVAGSMGEGRQSGPVASTSACIISMRRRNGFH